MAYLGRRGALAPVTSADIPDNSITAAKIVADTIAAGDIADDAVGTAELANDVVINTSGAIAGTGGLTIDGATVFNEASADVDFRVEGNGNENMLVVDASADRIGIGTNAPSETVEMAGGFMKLTGAEGGSTGLIMWADEGDDAADKWRIIAKSAGGLDFGYGASYTAALSIDSSGNVGIGCTNPNVASFQSGSRVLSIEGDGADDFGVIELRSTDTTSANRIGEIRFVNKDATTSYVGQAGIRAFRDGADDATALGFYTEVANGSMTERMRIDSAGGVTFAKNLAFTESGTTQIHNSVGISANQTTLIQGGGSGRGAFAIVWGYTGAQRWIDYLLVGRTSVSVQASFSFFGSAPTRTYTCTNYTALNLNTNLASTISVVYFYH